MSLHYIIDGYNLIKRTPHLAEKDLQSGREELLKLLQPYVLRHRVTVVFDGRPDVYSLRRPSDIKVIFTKNESADQKIKKIVENSHNPKEMVVVSDDKEILFYVRGIGAQTVSTKDFLVKSKKTRRSPSQLIEKAELSPEDARAITRQLEKIWSEKETPH